MLLIAFPSLPSSTSPCISIIPLLLVQSSFVPCFSTSPSCAPLVISIYSLLPLCVFMLSAHSLSCLAYASFMFLAPVNRLWTRRKILANPNVGSFRRRGCEMRATSGIETEIVPWLQNQRKSLDPFLIDESLATSSCCELLPYLHREKIAQEIKTKEAWRQIAQNEN